MSVIKKPLLQNMAEETNAIPETEEGLKKAIILISDKDSIYTEAIAKQESITSKEEQQEEFVFNPNEIEPLIVHSESLKKGEEEFRKGLFVDLETDRRDDNDRNENNDDKKHEDNINSIIQLSTDEEKEI